MLANVTSKERWISLGTALCARGNKIIVLSLGMSRLVG